MIIVMKDLKFIYLVLILLISCGEEDYINPDLLFTHCYPIPVSSYEYQDSLKNSYVISGDTACILNITDTINAIPVLAWDSIYVPIITVAIFRKGIEISGGSIQNKNDIVWQWHTGMSSSVYLNGMQRVNYTDGRNVKNSEIDYSSPADSLSGGMYYWAIWGWATSGVDIIYSSRDLYFYVKN